MRDLTLSFSGGVPWWVALALVTVAIIVIVWAYRRNRDRLSSRQLAYLTLLRGVLLALLLCCLVEPVLSYRASPYTDAPVLFLVDVSKSMSIPDMPGRRPRIEAALEPWIGPQHLTKELERKFAVHYYVFDAGTRRLAGADELERQEASGEMTLIGEAFISATAQTGADEPTGIVMLTDGANLSSLDPVSQARAIGAPVYVVAVGDTAASHKGKPDLAVVDVAGERFMSLNAENEIVVTLEQRGYTGQTVTVEVTDGDRQVAAESVEIDDTSMDVQMRVTPTELGKHTFETVARPFDSEEITENNKRNFSAIVEKRQLAVLYIEGTPRWEYKFLKRALEREPIVNFTGFVRGKSDLFIRQGERVGNGAMPVSAEEFAPFDLVILGDLSPALLSGGQMRALRDAVIEQGKGFVMLPGARSTEAGGFGGTPLAEIVPALPLDSEGGSVVGDFVPRLTSEGRDHPIFAGLSSGTTISASSMPGCLVLARPGAGASVLAVHPSERRNGSPLPICLTQTAGRGRTMVMATDSTWRWRMGSRDGTRERSLHTRFWGQAVRWLTGTQDESGDDDMPFIAYTSQDYYEPGQSVVLYARIRRKDDETGAETDVTARVRSPSGETMTSPLDYVAGSSGLYQAKLSFADAGMYTTDVSAATRDGQPVGDDTAVFFIGRPYGEFDRIEMNERLLRTLAAETGGAFYTPDRSSSIPADIVETAARRAILTEKKFARMPSIYGLMVACASMEWFLRKRRGLM